MERDVTPEKLQEVLSWAKSKAHGGSEPPWAWFQYMKLIETLESVIKGIGSTRPTENLLSSGTCQGSGLRLVDANFRQDISQHHQDAVEPQLPM